MGGGGFSMIFNINNLQAFQNIPANNINSSLLYSVSQPQVNGNMAGGLASVIGGLFNNASGSSQATASSPMQLFSSTMPSMGALGGFFGSGSTSSMMSNPLSVKIQEMQTKLAGMLDEMPVMDPSGVGTTLIKRYKFEGENERIGFISEKDNNGLVDGWFKETEDKKDYIENLTKNIKVDSSNMPKDKTDRINIVAKSFAEQTFNAYPGAKDCSAEKKAQIINGLEKIAKGENIYTEDGLDKNAEAALLIFEKDPNATSPDPAKINGEVKLIQSLTNDLSGVLKKGIDQKENSKRQMSMAGGASSMGAGQIAIDPSTGMLKMPEMPTMELPESLNSAEESESEDIE